MPNNHDYAVIVGIKNYDALKSLDAPIRDAINFKDWLQDSEGGDVPEENIKFIKNTRHSSPYPPTQLEIDKALIAIKNQGKETGYRRLYFYFSGHGIGVSWSDIGLCLPIWSEDFLHSAISTTAYLNYFVTSNLFDEVLFFLDCCRTRRIGVQSIPPTVGWAREGGKLCRNSMKMFATDYEDVAREGWTSNDTGNYITGYFTEALIEGLKGGAADVTSGNITAGSLQSFVARRTKELAAANGHVQNAKISLPEAEGDFLIKGGARPEISVHIRFKRAAEVTLYGAPAISVIKTDTIASGDEWIISLPQGLYMISEEGKKNKQFFEVEFSQNPFTYEY